jgi:prefoldin subunit 5
MLEFAVLPVSLTCDRLRMEINPIRRQIEELKQRTDALRGYL